MISCLSSNIGFIFTYVAPEISPIYSWGDNGIDILSQKVTTVMSDLNDVSVIVAGDLNARVMTSFLMTNHHHHHHRHRHRRRRRRRKFLFIY